MAIRPKLTPLRLALAGLALAMFAFVLLWILPSSSYIFLPDRAHPVDPLVKVEGGHRPKDGGIYFVDIFVRKASLIERLWPGIHEGAQLVPASALLAPGESNKQRQLQDKRSMTRSQSIAAAVALRAAGYRVKVTGTGALIQQVAADVPASGKLLANDVVVTAAREHVRTPADLRRIVSRLRPGSTVRLGVRRGSQLVQIPVRTIADPHRRGRSIIGVFVGQNAAIKLPLKVKIDVGDVGGPSAGLAFALDVLEQLGRDVDRGQRVAATGQLELDGSVTPIGGVKQKTIGVRKSGIHIFLVPAGENAAEARRYADGVRIIPVHSFRQALRSLATATKSAA